MASTPNDPTLVAVLNRKLQPRISDVTSHQQFREIGITVLDEIPHATGSEVLIAVWCHEYNTVRPHSSLG
jgi:hypothetical protein